VDAITSSQWFLPAVMGLATLVFTQRQAVWGYVKRFIPSVTPKPAPTSELAKVLATIRGAEVYALDKPADVRNAFLAESDKFAASVKNLYAETAK
jgi:hypothetical protein